MGTWFGWRDVGWVSGMLSGLVGFWVAWNDVGCVGGFLGELECC